MNNLLNPKERILVTGGAGFIGGALIRSLLKNTECKIYNLDKIGYASDLESINKLLINKPDLENKYEFIKYDLVNENSTNTAIEYVKPDIIFHLAAESHVDRSIAKPLNFINSNILGTFNLINAALDFWSRLPINKKNSFRLIHVSTDEVFGSITSGRFSESSRYDPRSPYSASKAASDHLANAWHHTYGLPIITTNCSNNYGPWQFPEKLIPLSILNGIKKTNINIYGDGNNIRDWIFVDDHVEALIKIANKGKIGNRYCIGSNSEKTNLEVANKICNLLDINSPINSPHKKLIRFVKDRPGHDQRYAIDSSKLKEEIDWEPRYDFDTGLEKTFNWYFNNILWCNKVSSN
tara:strand:+ start:6120 stop:7172 length:1053 start_codon:yes stop_codon:yes gene_type:complete